MLTNESQINICDTVITNSRSRRTDAVVFPLGTAMRPTAKKISVAKPIGDCFVLFLTFLPVILLESTAQPYHRGLNCDDESIKYPYKEDTITNLTAFLVGFLVNVFFIVVVESYRLYVREAKVRDAALKPEFLVGNKGVPRLISRLYYFIGWFLFGVAMTLTVTEIGKYSIGRLRPHFWSVCKPDPGKLECLRGDPHAYISEYECTGDPKHIKEARVSFPSGHSSFSFYCAVWLILYLQSRVHWNIAGIPMIRALMQLIFFCLAFACAMSRISDYKHHWSDVLCGSIIGIFMGILTGVGLARLFHSKRFGRTIDAWIAEDEDDYGADAVANKYNRPTTCATTHLQLEEGLSPAATINRT